MNSELVAQFVKRFAKGPVVQAVLRQPTDHFSVTVLFGPSGCGKTTTLRCLAGLEKPEEGYIAFGGTTWFDARRGVFLTPQQRDIGYLFQEYALFPHLTVSENIAYGLSDLSRAEQQRRVADILGVFRLSGLERRYPHEVSGGQQQRVPLARVLVRRPRLLLLDEPLSALDDPTREQLRPELRRLLAGFGIPVVLVTHNRVEAMALADHLIGLDQGIVRQQGSVLDVFNRPADLEVARIVGMETVQHGRVLRIEDGLATVVVGSVQLVALPPAEQTDEVYVCVRGEDVVLQRYGEPVTSARNRLPGVVRSLTPEGPMIRVALDCGFSLTALATRPACEELGLHEGAKTTALLKAPSVYLIARNTQPHQQKTT
jgi:molybdate transport system ATP-binding protein